MKKIIRLENGRTKVITVNEKPSKTQKHMQDQCDVNLIMKKYPKVQQDRFLRSPLSNAGGAYLDLINVGDYQESLNLVLHAQEAFQTLPAEIRKRFGNNPQELIQFLENPNNRDQAIELGLVIPPIQTNTTTTTNKNTSPPQSSTQTKTSNKKPQQQPLPLSDDDT